MTCHVWEHFASLENFSELDLKMHPDKLFNVSKNNDKQNLEMRAFWRVEGTVEGEKAFTRSDMPEN